LWWRSACASGVASSDARDMARRIMHAALRVACEAGNLAPIVWAVENNLVEYSTEFLESAARAGSHDVCDYLVRAVKLRWLRAPNGLFRSDASPKVIQFVNGRAAPARPRYACGRKSAPNENSGIPIKKRHERPVANFAEVVREARAHSAGHSNRILALLGR